MLGVHIPPSSAALTLPILPQTITKNNVLSETTKTAVMNHHGSFD
jgi:hypothetical protein